MSGFEVFGLLAGAAQLATSSISIVTSMSEIYHRVQDAPERIQRDIQQVSQLIDTAHLIEEHELLQTENIGAHISSTLTQATLVYAILERIKKDYFCGRFCQRSWKLLKDSREREITSGFERLEQQKSALLLSISVVHTDLLGNIRGTLQWCIDRSLVAMPGSRSRNNKLQKKGGDMPSASESKEQDNAYEIQPPQGRKVNPGMMDLAIYPSRNASTAGAPVNTNDSIYNYTGQQSCQTGLKTAQAQASNSRDTHHQYLCVTSGEQSVQLNGDHSVSSSQVANPHNYQGVDSNGTSTQVNGNTGAKALEKILKSGAERRGAE